MSDIRTEGYRLTFERFDIKEGLREAVDQPIAAELRILPKAKGNKSVAIDELFEMLKRQVKSSL